MNIEIERKFLLKSLPDKAPDETIEMNQWYLKNSDNIWERARSCYSDKNGLYFIHTIKTPTEKSNINMEDEKFLTLSEFNKFIEKCRNDSESRYISKDRLIFKNDGDDLFWEVDIFKNGHHLIIAELEIPTEEYEINIPSFINDKILLEVTEMSQFSNKNLSNKIK